MRLARFDGSRWSSSTVDIAGQSPSLSFAPDGIPGIAYATSTQLRFARMESQGWDVTTVDASGGESPSLAFGTNNLPVIAYVRDGVRFAQQLSMAPPVINSPPQAQTTIAGGQTTLSVNASGVGLGYQWRLNGVEIPAATSATYTIPSSQSFHSGNYTVVVTNEAGAVTSLPAIVTVNASLPSNARLTNISNRAFCGSGSLALILGFVISADGAKTLLVRAVGPALGSQFAVAGALADPVLRIYRHESNGTETPILINDNWSAGPNADAASTAAASARVGAFALPNNSRDAALVATLSSGVYTAHVTDVGTATGIALVEVYEVP